MTSPRFAWRPVFGADAAWSAFWIFVLPLSASIWLLFLCEWLGFPLPEGISSWMVIPVILLFLPMQVAVVRSLLDTRERLVIDAEGVMWRPWSAQVIPWGAIQQVTHTQAVTQDYVGLWLDDPRRHGATRLTRFLSWHARHGDVPIHVKATGATTRQLLDGIANFRPDLIASGS